MLDFIKIPLALRRPRFLSGRLEGRPLGTRLVAALQVEPIGEAERSV
jgi:hypothetical protein